MLSTQGLLAAAVLALNDDALASRLDAFRQKQTDAVAERPEGRGMTPLPPGSSIGILGGGQLARMLALAAAPLGLKCHIFAPEADSPAFQVADTHTVAAYADEAVLTAFAAQVQAVTYEFENVPSSTVAFLEKLVPVRPGGPRPWL